MITYQLMYIPPHDMLSVMDSSNHMLVSSHPMNTFKEPTATKGVPYTAQSPDNFSTECTLSNYSNQAIYVVTTATKKQNHVL